MIIKNYAVKIEIFLLFLFCHKCLGIFHRHSFLNLTFFLGIIFKN